jgi:photosystem II stability/assembly factor-like uncharacterized protein
MRGKWAQIALILTVLFLIAGCAPVTSPPAQPSPTPLAEARPPASRQGPSPHPSETALTGNNLNGVWGSSARDVFVVGDEGTILHYDGSVWKPMPSSTDQGLFATWGSSARDVYATGDNGTFLHYDGNVWFPQKSYPYVQLGAVWGASGSDVYFTADNVIRHYDGNVFRMSGDADAVLRALWGSSANDVYATGDDGTFLHYDGNVWFPQKSYPYVRLGAVWGTSGSNVYFTADNGIRHYDGTVFRMSGAADSVLRALWGSSANDVFAAGDNGTILHYDGTAWSPMQSDTTSHLYDLWGSSGGDVFAVGGGGTILHYDGSAWSPMAAAVD